MLVFALSGCSRATDAELPEPSSGTAGLSSSEVGEQRLPTVESSNTDRTNPEAVAKDFVTILETHDAGVDVDEWTSLNRAADLMTPAQAKAQLAYTAGDSDSDWELWRENKALITPIVSLTKDRTPPDTDQKVFKVIRAQLRPTAVEEEVDLPPRERIHFLTLERLGSHWSVAVWKAGPLEETRQQEAGSISRDDVKEPTP